MNLVLIGYRGTGKSTLSDAIHLRLKMPVYHMDEILEERFGVKIPSFVEKNGWDSFREEEQLLAEELSTMDNVIIDCGGGVVTRDVNIENLRRTGFVVWLQLPPEVIVRRIGGDPNRPSLTGKSSTDEVIDVLNERMPLYEKASDMKLSTHASPFDDCANTIINEWEKAQQSRQTL